MRLLVISAAVALLSLWVFYDEMALSLVDLPAALQSKFIPSALLSNPPKDKGVIVCGASTGIGEQIAYLYAKHGAKVVLVARRESVLQQVAQRCLKLGASQAHVVPADLSSSEEAQRVIQTSIELLGEDNFHILVLNHIMTFFQNWLDVPDYTVSWSL